MAIENKVIKANLAKRKRIGENGGIFRSALKSDLELILINSCFSRAIGDQFEEPV